MLSTAKFLGANGLNINVEIVYYIYETSQKLSNFFWKVLRTKKCQKVLFEYFIVERFNS